jgi:hypothetical protein
MHMRCARASKNWDRGLGHGGRAPHAGPSRAGKRRGCAPLGLFQLPTLASCLHQPVQPLEQPPRPRSLLLSPVQPSGAMAEVDVKLFGKWSYGEVEVRGGRHAGPSGMRQPVGAAWGPVRRVRPMLQPLLAPGACKPAHGVPRRRPRR